MKYDSVAQMLTEVRLALENKIIDGKLVKVKLSLEIEFLQQISVLIPNDLLYSLNLHYPPWLVLRVWWHGTDPSTYLTQRYHDLDRMIARVVGWYDLHLPSKSEINGSDIDLLLELKDFFLNLKVKNDQLLSTITQHPVHGHSRNQLCCLPAGCVCSTGTCWDSFWEMLFYCYFYLFLLHFPRNQAIDSKFDLTNQYEGPYGAGGARKYYCPLGCGNESSEGTKIYNNCTCNCDGCVRCCSDCCWYCSTPTYHDSHCHHHHDYHDHYHHDGCCRECMISIGLLDGCQACCTGCFQGISTIIQLSLEGFGNCCSKTVHLVSSICSSGCHRLPDCNCDCKCHEIFEGCGNCDCPFKDDCVAAVSAIFGAIGGAIGLVLDATSGSGDGNDDSNIPTNTTNTTVLNSLVQDDGSPQMHRILNAETSSEYTPSIVFMSFALLIFLPRILPNLFYTIVNLSQGVSQNHSIKVLASMFLIGLPMALILASLGGASRWTYVSLILMFMHSMYAIYSVQRKKVSPSLMDLSYLSCSEWREFNYGTDSRYLGSIINTLVRYQDTFRHEARELKQRSRIFGWIKVIWPTVDKAYIRWKLRDEISSSHQLDLKTLQERYGSQPVMDAPSPLPMATIVQTGDSSPYCSDDTGLQHQQISRVDRL